MSAELAGGVIATDPWQQMYIDGRGNGPKLVSDHEGVHATVQV